MGTFVSMGDAANRLVDCTKVTPDMARKVLVAYLIEERATAVCESYWRESWPSVDLATPEDWQRAPWDQGVPADFWRMDHANHSPANIDGTTPSGSWARWDSENSTFRTEIDLTGYAAASRFADFRDLAQFGSMPVRLDWGAFDVRLHVDDLDRVVRIGRNGFSALLRRVERRPSVRWGNVSKSDVERLLTRLIVSMAGAEGRNDILDDQDGLKNALRAVADNVSQEAAISDDAINKLANLIAIEAQTMNAQDGPPG